MSSREGNVVDNNGGVGASEQTTTFTTYPSSLPGMIMYDASLLSVCVNICCVCLAYEDTPAELREEYQSRTIVDHCI